MKPNHAYECIPAVNGRGRIRAGFARALTLSVILVTIVLVSNGMAGTVKGYIGAGIGNARSTFDTLHMGFGKKDLSTDQTAWRLFAGAQVNRYLGVEAGYIHFGKPRAHTEPDVRSFEAELTGFDLTPVGTLPIGSGFSAFGRAGLIFWQSEMTSVSPGEEDRTSSSSASNLVLGLGVKYEIGRYMGLRAEFTRYAVSKFGAGLGDLNFISISGILMLGWRQ